MDRKKECKICGLSFDYKSGWFTTHLVKEHNIQLNDYIIKYELENKTPKCKCGFCDEDAPFYRGVFLDRIGDHQKYKWLQEQYIIKNGIPKCVTCDNDVKWKRGLPNKYCSFKCLPNRWNQDKVKETVKRIYGVNCISQLDEVKEKISIKQKNNYLLNKDEIVNKLKDTCIEKYGVDSFSKTDLYKIKSQKSYFITLGVNHPSKVPKFRNDASLRMIKNNSTFNFKNSYKIRKYKDTNLYYQSSYELHFLEHCVNNGILNKVKNGNIYNFLEEEHDYGHRTITDFSIDNIEIEIKSMYFLEKQGGETVIDIKRRSVERDGKKYLLILDKNYTEFDKCFKIKNKNE